MDPEMQKEVFLGKISTRTVSIVKTNLFLGHVFMNKTTKNKLVFDAVPTVFPVPNPLIKVPRNTSFPVEKT